MLRLFVLISLALLHHTDRGTEVLSVTSEDPHTTFVVMNVEGTAIVWIEDAP